VQRYCAACDRDSRIISSGRIVREMVNAFQWAYIKACGFNLHLCNNSNKDFNYELHKEGSHCVNEEKDLGVFITSNLKPARQCQQAYNKASRPKAAGLIKKPEIPLQL